MMEKVEVGAFQNQPEFGDALGVQNYIYDRKKTAGHWYEMKKTWSNSIVRMGIVLFMH